MRSIRSRMIFVILGVIALCWLALIPLTQSQIREQINSLMDQRAEYMADALLVILEGEVKEADTAEMIPNPVRMAGPIHHYESETPLPPFQLWFAGQLRARAASTPDFKKPEVDTPMWQELTLNGEDWRILTRRKKIEAPRFGGELQYGYSVVGIRLSELDALADSLVGRSSWPIFASLPILAVVVFLGIGIGLRPLRRLAEQVSRRSPNRLRAVSAEHVPGEVLPLVNSLNHLFHEVQRAFANERRFTADAAHELRTPLSALSAQAQVALRASDGLAKEEALRQIVNGVDRMTHLVSQLLTLARLDPQTELEGEETDLLAVTTELMADVAPIAIDKDLDYGLEASGTAVVRADPSLLSVMIRNLLDNAVKYTPPRGEVKVSIMDHGDRIELNIADTGPGVPREHYERVFQRFFRLHETDEYGTGLGLSIAAHIASLHKADIEFRDRDGPGLVVAVNFTVDQDDAESATA